MVAPADVTGLEVEIQAVLADVRALVADRDRLVEAILNAPHVGYCGSYADRDCDCWKSDVRLRGTSTAPTVSSLIGTTSQAGYAQPATCSTGHCSCLAKDARIAELQRALEQIESGQMDFADAISIARDALESCGALPKEVNRG